MTGAEASLEQKPRGRGRITPRESEIMALIADGLTLGQIAAKLQFSLASVKYHFRNFHIKLFPEAGVPVLRATSSLHSGLSVLTTEASGRAADPPSVELPVTAVDDADTPTLAGAGPCCS